MSDEPIDLAKHRKQRKLRNMPRAQFVQGGVRLVQLYKNGVTEPGKVGLCLPIDDPHVPGVVLTSAECRELAAQLLKVASVLENEGLDAYQELET